MTTVSALYQAQISSGHLQLDEAQQAALDVLDAAISQRKGVSLADMQKQGVYLYGPVGRGKSMLASLAYQAAPEPKRRVHFHSFMEEVHQLMHRAPRGVDVMTHIAQTLHEQSSWLLFDEFYVTNIADAMLLGRLFEQMLAAGITVVATSNWAPQDLFQGGINRHQFMPFIRLIEGRFEVVEVAGPQDWRTKDAGAFPLVIDACTAEALPALQTLFERFSEPGGASVPEDIPLQQLASNAAWYRFDDLCGAAVGREEYLQLVAAVKTLVIEAVPRLKIFEADAALRFITLVDVAYEAKCRMILSTDVSIPDLVDAGPALQPFQRCLSRLTEMQGWV